MYKDPSPGEDVAVDPPALDQQGAELAKLGDTLRQQATREPVEPAKLGTAPPAQWLAGQLAEIGRNLPEALLNWAGGLNSLGDNVRTTARKYRGTEDLSSVTFTGLDPDGTR